MEFPQIYGRINGRCEKSFNSYYLTRAERRNSYVRTKLKSKAEESYIKKRDGGFPFDFFIFDEKINVPYLTNFYISVITDFYFFEGGAHGMTTRRTETWDTQRGGIIPLGKFFAKGYNYRKVITDFIAVKISDDLKSSSESVYYKNSPERCKRFFNEKRYYLSDEGFVFYYPSYSIAPYCEGIQTFEIPFELFREKLRYIPDRII